MLVLLITVPLTMVSASEIQDKIRQMQDAYKKGDYETAFKIAEPLAQQGNADMQFALGLMYAYGQYVQQNGTEAVKWYRRSAEKGNLNAQYNLGVAYYNGKIIPQDYEESYKWFRLAADGGDKKAKEALGAVYPKAIAQMHARQDAEKQAAKKLAREAAAKEAAEKQAAEKIAREASAKDTAEKQAREAAANKEAYANNFKQLKSNYKAFVDEANKSWSEELIKVVSANIVAEASHGNHPKAALLSQYMELIMTDASICAKDSRQRNLALSKAQYYKNVKNEVLGFCAEEYRQATLDLLKQSKNYYYTTKTRAAGFGQPCRGKVLSSK